MRTGWEDEITYDQIQKMMDSLLGKGSFSFSDCVEKLLQPKQQFSFQKLFEMVGNSIWQNFVHEKKMFFSLFFLALIGAVFSNFSKLIQEKQVANTAFYSIYLLFVSILTATFAQISAAAAGTLNSLFSFMKVLLPSYFISLSFSQGAGAAGIFYEFTLSVLTIMNALLVQVVLPAVNFYFYLSLIDALCDKKMFQKMAELIHNLLTAALKTMFTLVMGMHVIQGLLVPAASGLKKGIFLRLTSSIPGVGDVVTNTAQTMLSTAVLLKNAVGVAGLIAIVIIVASPLIQMTVNWLLYQLTAALVQPVSDQRIIQCLEAAAKGVKLFMFAVGLAGLLFCASILIISTMTNRII